MTITTYHNHQKPEKLEKESATYLQLPQIGFPSPHQMPHYTQTCIGIAKYAFSDHKVSCQFIKIYNQAKFINFI